MPRQNWNRNDTLVAFNLYCRTPFGRLHARNPEIIQVAAALGRTPSALAMKCCNLAAFDTSLSDRGIHGLRKASQLDETVWRDFEREPETVAFDAEQAYSNLLQCGLRTSESVEWEDVQGLDRAVVTKVRVNQYFFRSLILTGYRNRCAVCELPLATLLVASHIVPWSVDGAQRMNPRNGICLCNLHDRAFDRGLLFIDPDYRLSINPRVEAASSIKSVADGFLRFVGQSIRLPDRWHPDPTLLQRHAELAAVNLD